MSHTPHIVVIGSLNMDLIAYVPHHPLAGESVTCSSYSQAPGGKGANQAVACARLSLITKPGSGSANPNPSTIQNPSPSGQPPVRVSMIGAVGAKSVDRYGDVLIDALGSSGVDVSGVTRCGDVSTGLALITVDRPTGENRIVVVTGANGSLTPNDFTSPSSLSPSTTPPDLLLVQLELTPDTVLAVMRTARAASVPVLLNAAPAPPPGVFPVDALADVTHLVVNETEAVALAGDAARDLDSPDGLASACRWFLDAGVGTIVLTLGERGAYFSDRHGHSGLVPAEKARAVVDTTAAGDTFIAAYALAVVAAAAAEKEKGKKGDKEEENETSIRFDVQAAVARANHAARLTVEREGSQSSIPWGYELASSSFS